VARRTQLAPRSDLIGIGLAIAAATAFGTLAIFAKKGYEEGAGAFPLLAGRFVVTAVLLLAFLLVTRAPIAIGGQKIVRLLLLGAFGYGVEASLFFLALERAPASVVGLVFYSYPMWTTLIAIAAGLERFDKRLLIALLLGTAGIASIFSFTSTPLAGPLFALGAAVMVALFYIGAQILTEETPPGAAALWTAAGAALGVGVVVALQGEGLPRDAVIPALGLGLATAFAFVATYAAVKRIGSSKTAVANMTELVTTIVLAALFLSEEITLRVLLGAVLVLSAIPILAAKKREALPAADGI
jgi:drug/metabolite transporter (DMT)-like permease